MEVHARRAAIAAITAIVAGYAWAPILGADLTRGEFAALDGAACAYEAGLGSVPAALFEVDGTRGHPLAALDLVRMHALWSNDGAWPAGSALALRIEGLALVALSALALSRSVRRLFAPWTGKSQARAAGWAAAMVLALHPLLASAVASVDARGELLALALGLGALWAFLHGRQEGRIELTALAGASTVAAGLASDSAFALPFALAGAELFSSRRGRPLARRAQTALTTLVVFGACAGLDAAVRSLALGSASAPSVLAANAELGWPVRLATAFERLGTLLLPVDVSVLGAWGFVLAGVLLLAAFERIVVAVRSAPRLWGWLAGAWLAALALTEAASAPLRVRPDDLGGAHSLAAGAAVVAAGFGTCATALASRFRPAWLALFALAPALLAHGSAASWRDASAIATAMRARIGAARTEHPGARELIVVEPPRRALGVDGLAGAFPALGRPRFDERPLREARVRGASVRAVCALARDEQEFSALLRHGLVVLAPESALAPDGSDEHVAIELASERPPSAPPLSWHREGRSPALDLDPAATRALTVRAGEGADTSTPPRAAWAADAELPRLRGGSIAGAWSYSGEAPEAVFDFSASLAWLCANRVRQIWPAAGWSRAASAELSPDLPEVHGELARGERDWRLRPGEVEPGDAWVLELVDLETLQTIAIELEPDASGAWVAREVGRAVRQLSIEPDSTVDWALERRRGGAAIERTRGGAAR